MPLGAMQHTHSLHGLALQSINNNVWERSNYELARAPYASLSSHSRLVFQECDLTLDPLANSQRCDRVVVRDVVLDPIQIAVCTPRPLDTHALQVKSCVSLTLFASRVLLAA